MISHLVESQIDQMNVIRLVEIYPHPVVNLTEANKPHLLDRTSDSQTPSRALLICLFTLFLGTSSPRE